MAPNEFEISNAAWLNMGSSSSPPPNLHLLHGGFVEHKLVVAAATDLAVAVSVAQVCEGPWVAIVRTLGAAMVVSWRHSVFQAKQQGQKCHMMQLEQLQS